MCWYQVCVCGGRGLQPPWGVVRSLQWRGGGHKMFAATILDVFLSLSLYSMSPSLAALCPLCDQWEEWECPRWQCQTFHDSARAGMIRGHDWVQEELQAARTLLFPLLWRPMGQPPQVPQRAGDSQNRGSGFYSGRPILGMTHGAASTCPPDSSGQPEQKLGLEFWLSAACWRTHVTASPWVLQWAHFPGNNSHWIQWNIFLSRHGGNSDITMIKSWSWNHSQVDDINSGWSWTDPQSPKGFLGWNAQEPQF